jgi:hypothetical protein
LVELTSAHRGSGITSSAKSPEDFALRIRRQQDADAGDAAAV